MQRHSQLRSPGPPVPSVHPLMSPPRGPVDDPGRHQDAALDYRKVSITRTRTIRSRVKGGTGVKWSRGRTKQSQGWADELGDESHDGPRRQCARCNQAAKVQRPGSGRCDGSRAGTRRAADRLGRRHYSVQGAYAVSVALRVREHMHVCASVCKVRRWLMALMEFCWA